MSTRTSDDRRQELARIAYLTIIDSGIEGMTMRGVAERAGCTTGSIVHHFADRSELLGAALDYANAVAGMRLDKADDLGEWVTQSLPLSTEGAQQWRVWLSVWAQALSVPSIRNRHLEMYSIWHAAFVDRVREAQAAGIVRKDLDVALVADHLMSVVDGVGMRATLDPDRWPEERQRALIAQALDAFVERSSD